MNRNQIYKNLGINIKTKRKALGYTQHSADEKAPVERFQRGLADRIKKGQQFVGKIETAVLETLCAQVSRLFGLCPCIRFDFRLPA